MASVCHVCLHSAANSKALVTATGSSPFTCWREGSTLKLIETWSCRSPLLKTSHNPGALMHLSLPSFWADNLTAVHTSMRPPCALFASKCLSRVPINTCESSSLSLSPSLPRHFIVFRVCNFMSMVGQCWTGLACQATCRMGRLKVLPCAIELEKCSCYPTDWGVGSLQLAIKLVICDCEHKYSHIRSIIQQKWVQILAWNAESCQRGCLSNMFKFELCLGSSICIN